MNSDQSDEVMAALRILLKHVDVSADNHGGYLWLKGGSSLTEEEYALLKRVIATVSESQ